MPHATLAHWEEETALDLGETSWQVRPMSSEYDQQKLAHPRQDFSGVRRSVRCNEYVQSTQAGLGKALPIAKKSVALVQFSAGGRTGFIGPVVTLPPRPPPLLPPPPS